jgi:hypothetical protein
MNCQRIVFAGACAALMAVCASAAPLAPSSYDMLNGNGVATGGSFNYWDLFYTGSGSTNVDNAPLSGGLGDLTDGVIAVANWNTVENGAGTGPYVGWRFAFAPNPVVTFRFPTAVFLDSITVYVDDSNGAGGVSPPASVDIGLEGGPYTNFLTPDPPGSAPTSYTFSGLGLAGSAFDVRFNNLNEWVFVSEVTFDGVIGVIPEPSTLVLACGALAAAMILRRKRRAMQND